MGGKTQLCDWVLRKVPFAVYHPVKWFFFYFTASYFEICFQLRVVSKIIVVHSNLYYLGTWMIPLMCLIATFMPKVRRAKKTQEGAKTDGEVKSSAQTEAGVKKEEGTTTEE